MEIRQLIITLFLSCFYNLSCHSQFILDREHNMPRIGDKLPKVSLMDIDYYFFKLLDKQGEFMYVQQPKDTSMHYMCMPFQNVRIRLHGHHFQLTDDAGRRYRFDKETECVYGSKVTSRVWSPSCIVSSNGQDSISFSYANYIEDGHQCNDYITVIDRFSEHRGLLQRRDVYENSFNKTAAANMYPTPDYWMQSPSIYSRIYDGVKSEVHQLRL